MKSLRFHRLGQSSTAAIDAPAPTDGEVRHISIPDTFDGIRFQIGRMVKYVQDAANDPLVIANVDAICHSGNDLEDIEEWCREHYVYLNDPPNIEFIQTPRRMVKETLVPPEVIRHLMGPLMKRMSQSMGRGSIENYEPPPITMGDCDEGSVLILGHCAARGIVPLAFDFGGNKGTLHHVWGNAGGYASDLTEPNYKLGDHSTFEHYDSVEIPL